MTPVLYLVIPCYNEEEVLHETSARLTVKMEGMIKESLVAKESRILFVNDGSKDLTWSIIKELNQTNQYIVGISLSRNRGHQNCLLAGLLRAKQFADITISLDADLQDDVEVIDQFVKEYQKGSDIVYGVRSSRKTDKFFKRNSAQLFYKLMHLMGVEIVYNHADYRLMSKRALDELEHFKEVNLFLRGLIPLIGFKSSVVEYERHERFAGESKYPLKKMLLFALDGITSCSIKPIRFITSLGFLIAGASFLFLVYVMVIKIWGKTVQGWTTLAMLISLFGGLQIFCIGIVGEYVGKIYSETKRRPRFIIADEVTK